jgi:hypothetical protein
MRPGLSGSKDLYLPASFSYAGDLSSMRQFPETDPAQLEFSQHGMRTSATLTAGVLTHLKLLLAARLYDHRLFGQTTHTSFLREE